MCYDIQTKLETQLKRAKRKHDEEWMAELERQLRPYWDEPIYHASGFAHPKLLVYPQSHPNTPVPSTWGLVPHWVKDKAQQLKLWNSTLNARRESIFEKPSFRASARNKRCLIYLDGFYEHHYFKGNSYPFFIQRRDKAALPIAGLCSEWVDKESGIHWHTFAIVTTRANELLKKIHNNPKVPESRMPVILPEELEEEWLKPMHSTLDQQLLLDLLQPYPEDLLTAHTVRKLRGKQAVGNVPEASEEYVYAELQF